MHATLSFNGLLARYPKLFDDLKVPDNVSKDAVCNQLLFDTLELEVLYADGPTMRRALGVYSETMLPSWTRYAEALDLKYDALESDDRIRTTDHAGTSGGTINRTNGVKGTTTRAPNLTTTGQNTGSDTGAEQHRDLKQVINEFKVLHLRPPPASVLPLSDADGIEEPSHRLQGKTPTAPSRYNQARHDFL